MTEPLPRLPASPPEPPEPPSPPEPLMEPTEPPTEPPSFTRRHRTELIVAAVAVIALGAGTGIALAASAGSAAPAASASASTSPPASAPPSGQARAGKAIRATIVSESGSTWIVRTQAGQSVTVTITPRTKFGTRKAPATQAAFAVGAPVLVLGRETNGVIAATRVAAQVRAPSAHPSSTPAAPSVTTTA